MSTLTRDRRHGQRLIGVQGTWNKNLPTSGHQKLALIDSRTSLWWPARVRSVYDHRSAHPSRNDADVKRKRRTKRGTDTRRDERPWHRHPSTLSSLSPKVGIKAQRAELPRRRRNLALFDPIASVEAEKLRISRARITLKAKTVFPYHVRYVDATSLIDRCSVLRLRATWCNYSIDLETMLLIGNVHRAYRDDMCIVFLHFISSISQHLYCVVCE